MHIADRTRGFTESVIRGMTRLANQHEAINLAQGFPDFPAAGELKRAAADAVMRDLNQYAITWGTKRLRDALAARYAQVYGLEVDPERHITVTCGATEAMISALMSIVNPGDEVIVFEPFYENYGPDAILCGASPRFVPMPRDGDLDIDAVRSAVSPRTVAMVLNTPNNPTGRVLTATEMEGLAEICRKNDIWAVTDEIYEYIVYDGAHLPMAALPEMADRTITVSGASKTFGVTGWRVGTIVANETVTGAIRKVHDFLTVGAPAPLQDAVAYGLENFGDDYYESLAADYRERRDTLVPGLQKAGLNCVPPAGAYYVLADISGVTDKDDVAFSRWLTESVGVAPVPGSSFFHAGGGERLIRFAFCKTVELLETAVERLRTMS